MTTIVTRTDGDPALDVVRPRRRWHWTRDRRRRIAEVLEPSAER